MANFLSKLFGSKSQRDLKEVNPFLKATLEVYPAIKELTNDQLRAKTIEFKSRIQDKIKEEEEELLHTVLLLIVLKIKLDTDLTMH